MPSGIQIFGVIAIFGLDLALLGWDNYTADPYKARSDGQHNVGLLMIVVNLIGVGAAMIADSMRVIDPGGYSAAISVISVWVISVVILSNVAALIAVNQLDPDRSEAQSAAKHERDLAALKAQHERDLQRNDLKTELDVSAYRNQLKIKDARKRFYLDDKDGNGTADIVDSANRGDMAALERQLREALNAIEHASAKSPNGHSMAAEGEPAPKVTKA